MTKLGTSNFDVKELQNESLSQSFERTYLIKSAALTTRHPPPNPLKLALTSPTGGGRSVGIVRSQNKDMEL
jgi:hypothetical protein